MGPRIRQCLTGVFIAVTLALGSVPGESTLDQGVAARLAATPSASAVPLHVLATGEGPAPAGRPGLVWRVQHGAVSGEQRAAGGGFPLGFALAQRGALDVLGADGARIAGLDPGQAVFLSSGVGGSFASATGDLALFIEIALAPVSAAPASLPNRSVVSEAFDTPGVGILGLELSRGILNPGRQAAVPAGGTPALLLATDNGLRIKMSGGVLRVISRDETLLLGEAATVRNDGNQPATFVVARVTPFPAGGGTAPQRLDPDLDDAWRRSGCHLNPGNPSCLTVGLAIECANSTSGPECVADSDGDSCTDIAEVRLGFDASDATDCIGSGLGEPAVNCLFLNEEIACDGSRGAPDEDECVAAREIRLRRNPTDFHGCDAIGESATDACTLFGRDPACDGFAPGGG